MIDDYPINAGDLPAPAADQIRKEIAEKARKVIETPTADTDPIKTYIQEAANEAFKKAKEHFGDQPFNIEQKPVEEIDGRAVVRFEARPTSPDHRTRFMNRLESVIISYLEENTDYQALPREVWGVCDVVKDFLDGELFGEEIGD